MKVKLRNLSSVVYQEEKIQEVEYIYSIDDSLGLLKICLTIPESSDPVEQFVMHIKDLYKGYVNYDVYYGRFKYHYNMHKTINGMESYIVKTKMW